MSKFLVHCSRYLAGGVLVLTVWPCLGTAQTTTDFNSPPRSATDQQAPPNGTTEQHAIPSDARERATTSTLGTVYDVTRSPGGLLPLPTATVTVHGIDEGQDRAVVSDADGSFIAKNLEPGGYLLKASKEGFADSSGATVELAAGQNFHLDVPRGTQISSAPLVRNPAQGGFFKRFVKAYANDWKGTSDPGPQPPGAGIQHPSMARHFLSLTGLMAVRPLSAHRGPSRPP
jgi:hypothetical protein